ncbi:MAG: RpiB/LacA/LacB family sugar-phosphate isomerase [bacterium]|nr:RpiB/LacA/LacB family sugar-phosphate isomerase [bacterium]
MKIYLAGDHAGFELKKALALHLATLGYEVEDLGPATLDPEDDYPDYAALLAARIASEAGTRGILVCGTGEGEAMVANRTPGIRAAVFYGPMRVTNALEVEGGKSEDSFDIIRLVRRHNNANILCIGARFVLATEADEAVRIFLETPFSDAPRHARRLAKF